MCNNMLHPLVHELGRDPNASTSSRKNMINIHREGETSADHSLEVSFQRTIRVSDNNAVDNLPPGMGSFPLYKVSRYEDSLPASMKGKGGYFLPMHRT